MVYRTAPELSEVIVKSRELQGGEQIDPPEEWPVVFSCRYHGAESLGCVFLNGIVMIMPNHCVPGTGPLVVQNWRAVESDGVVTDIRFDWVVTRSIREDGPRLADVDSVEKTSP